MLRETDAGAVHEGQHAGVGFPAHLPALADEPFSSRSELDAYAKAKGMGLGASAEKVGGARNEEHLNMGKKYSYTGSPKS